MTGASLALAAGLRVPAAGVPAGGSLFVARVELVGGSTRLQVVAWAERQGDDVVTVARPHLPGLRRGGRYVVYHATPAVGFLTGTTRAAGDPRPALVTTAQLPFVGVSGADGAYTVLTLAGSVRASARVLGTSLVGSADTELAAGSVRALDIEVAQAVTLALVTPATGATGFPVTRQIELQATAPLDPTTVTAASVSLRRTSDGLALSVRTVLSADARHVAVIPQAPLAYLTGYTFESTGLLKDVYGAPVAVPVVEFTTQSQAQAQALDLDALVFSYPVDGMVTMRAPAGALPAGTQILVLNASVGSALTYTVGAVAVEAELRASIDDRLWVTVTDPQGKATTIERTEYVAPDGTTAVGVAGGTVRGPQGSEMRLPPGVTDAPVTIKLQSFPESALPEGQRPDLPGAHFGYGLAIQSADKPRFKQEVDLAFPRPAGAPEGAFFYVYRQIELPGGRVAFETIDQAFDEGGKVVTASFPFGGYQTSFGVLGLGAGSAQLQAQSLNHAILVWTHDDLTPGRAMAGAITGQVLRAGIDPATGELTYEPVPRRDRHRRQLRGEPAALRPRRQQRLDRAQPARRHLHHDRQPLHGRPDQGLGHDARGRDEDGHGLPVEPARLREPRAALLLERGSGHLHLRPAGARSRAGGGGRVARADRGRGRAPAGRGAGRRGLAAAGRDPQAERRGRGRLDRRREPRVRPRPRSGKRAAPLRRGDEPGVRGEPARDVPGGGPGARRRRPPAHAHRRTSAWSRSAAATACRSSASRPRCSTPAPSPTAAPATSRSRRCRRSRSASRCATSRAT